MSEVDVASDAPAVVGGGVCATERDAQSVRELFRRVGDKWSLNVVVELSPGPVRFMVLLQRIDGISHRLLAKTLKSLERDGLVTRVAYPEVPPRVEYALSPLGESLLEPVVALAGWAERHRAEVDVHRASYDARQPPPAPSE
ncbi:helix-turn-helix domain-containing protein, partial [Frankia sp. QA3]|uniref:winged helix-turn-helix transcriptional regulator n=1 Tax=Frankia sp. QA3 TaxID=710111 RepID=UPI000269C244